LLNKRLTRLFGDDRSFWSLMAFVAGFIAVGKGIRYPNLWGATQAQVDYHFGFVKRGLFGQVIAGPLGLEQYKRFACVSWLIMLVFLALLVLCTTKSHLSKHLNNYQIPALFFSSYGLTFLVDLAGYLDLFLAALAMAVLLIGNPRARFCAAIPICLAALLIHELFLYEFVPTLLMSFLLQSRRSGDGSGAWRERRSLLVMAVVLASVFVGTTVWISLRPSLPPERMVLMEQRVAARVDFPIRRDFFDVLTRSTEDNAKLMRKAYREGPWWIENAIGVVIFGPTILLLLMITRKLIRANSKAPLGTATLATLAALSPLALHLLGWDRSRWNSLVVLTSYLMLLTVCRSEDKFEIELSPAWRNAMVLVIVLNIASGSVLLDFKVENAFPFVHSLPVKELKSRGIVAPPI